MTVTLTPVPVTVNSTGETTKHWKGLMSNQQWFGCQISRPKSNCRKYHIESNPSRLLLNRIFELSIYSQKVLRSRFKSQLRLGFAHHCLRRRRCKRQVFVIGDKINICVSVVLVVCVMQFELCFILSVMLRFAAYL